MAGGKLSFQVQMEGGAETLAQMREIIAAQKQMRMGGGSGGSSGSAPGNIIRGLKEPDYGRALARIHAMGDINKPGGPTALSKFFDLSGTVGKIAAGFTLATLALKGFNAAVDASKSAIIKAFGIYTGAAQQGLSTRFYTNRQALAGILGVQGNPNNVFMFGKAVGELDKRISGAVSTISQNSRPLAELEINAKILKLDIEALASNITTQLAPALNIWINALDALTKIKPPRWMELALRSTAAIATMGGSELLGGLTKALGTKFGGGVGGLGQLSTMAKQLPASQWEHMGLVIGGQGTISLQKMMVDELKKLVAIASKKNNTGQSYYLGYNPYVNTP
jgi:hypothetical protein